jgi:predicted Zn-dependent peptidase
VNAAVATLALAAIVQTGALPHGGQYFIQADTTSPTAAVDLWFRAPDDGYGTPVPGLARVATTAAAAVKLENGRTLAEAVAQSGGHLSIGVFPDIIGIQIVAPAGDARMLLASLTAAYFAASIDAAALHTAQTDAAVLAVQQQYETGALEHALLFSQIFAAGPAHEPPIPFSAGDVSQVTLDEVTAFAQRAFRPGNAFVTLAGDVDASDVTAVADGSGSLSPDAPPYSEPVRSLPQPLAQTGAIPGLGMAWIGPPISDERAATALDFVADYLFHPGSGTISRALTRDNTQIDIGGQFITLHDPGVMLVTLEGSNDTALEQQITGGIAAMDEPLSPAAFDAAREAFLYHINADTQTADAEAENLGWYAAEGAPSYAPGGPEYDGIVRSLDPAFVAAVVRRYLSQPAIVIVTPASHTQGSS